MKVSDELMRNEPDTNDMVPSNHLRWITADQKAMQANPCASTWHYQEENFMLAQWWHKRTNPESGEWRPVEIDDRIDPLPPKFYGDDLCDLSPV